MEQNFDEFIKKLESLQVDLNEACRRITNRAINEGMGEAKRRTPVGVYDKEVFFQTRTGQQVHFVAKGINRQGGHLRKMWNVKPAQKTKDGWRGEFTNNVEYGMYVNFGHRVVRNGQTIGYSPGKFFLEAGVQFMKNHMSDYFMDEVKRAKENFEK